MSRLLDHVSPIVQEEDNQCFVARGLKSQTKMHELLTQINVRKLFDLYTKTWTRGFSIHEHKGYILITNGRDPN